MFKVNKKNDSDYNALIIRAAEISEKLTLRLNEEEQELFEEYVTIYEQILKYKHSA